MWVALGAPLLGVLACTQTLTARQALRFGQIFGLASSVGWFVVTLGGSVQSAFLTAQGVVGPIGMAMGLVAAAVEDPLTRRAIGARHGAVVVVMSGLALSGEAGSSSERYLAASFTLGVALVILELLDASDHMLHQPRGHALGLTGVFLFVMGVAIELPGPFASGHLMIVGSLMVLIATTMVGNVAAVTIFLPAVVGVTIGRSALLDQGDITALVLALIATLFAWAPRLLRHKDVPTNFVLVIGTWALAVGVTGDTTGALLLAAPAALMTLTTSIVPVVACAPGVVVIVTHLANGLSFEQTTSRFVFGLLTTLSIAGLVNSFPMRGAARVGATEFGRAASLIGVALSAWLLVAPTTWGWVSTPGQIESLSSPLGSWAYGSAPALAVAAIMSAAGLLKGRTTPQHLKHLLQTTLDLDPST